MATQQLFYQTAVPVNPARHRDWSVKTGESYAFAAAVNSVPLVTVEFADAAAAHPVVFAGDGNAVFPAAILGLRDNENLCVGADGAWTGGYIPAFIRRYPFVFSHDEAAQTFTLLLDETFPGCNQDNRGERLFDADGAQTAYLRSILGFLQEYQARFQQTQAFCRRIVELGLLQPMQAQFTLPGAEPRSLTGFLGVDRAKLRALAPEVLADMMSRDELEVLYLHLASLRHFQTLPGRIPAASPAAAASTEPMPEAPATTH